MDSSSAQRAVVTLLERLPTVRTWHLALIQIQANGSAIGEELAHNAITRVDVDAAAGLRDGGGSQGVGSLGFQLGYERKRAS